MVLYTHYLVKKEIMESYDLINVSRKLDTVKKVEDYVEKNAPKAIAKNIKKSYIKRLFYTFASQYKDLFEYKGMKKMYDLTHRIIKYGEKQSI